MEFIANKIKPNTYSRDYAENRMREEGFSIFSFCNVSYANGCSFYFELEDGRKVRLSDHPLTGKRAFEYIQIHLVVPSNFPNPSDVRKMYLNAEISKKEYKEICKQRGFVFRP